MSDTEKIVKNVIFDWSGTLSDNNKSFYFVVDQFCKHFNRKTPSIDEVRKIFTNPYMKFWNQLFPKLKHSEQKKLYEKFIHMAPEAKVIEGAKEMISIARKRGYNVYILSSDPQSKITGEIEKSGFGSSINEVICDIHDKPKELKKLVERLNMKKDLTYYAGDSKGDIESGKYAGVKTIGVTWGFNSKDKLMTANPDFIAEKMDDIEKILA